MRIFLPLVIATIALLPAVSLAQNGHTFQDAAKTARTPTQLETVRILLLADDLTATNLEELAAINTGAYVYVLQRFLADQKLYSGNPMGVFNSATAKALMSFCKAGGFDVACHKAPLGPEAIALTAAEIARIDAAQGNPMPHTGISGAAVGDPGTLPPGWWVQASGQGLASEVTAVSDQTISIRVHGAQADGVYYNVILGGGQQAFPVKEATRLRINLQAKISSSGSAEPDVQMRIGLLDADGTYKGELFDGVALTSDGQMANATGKGKVPAGVASVYPYVQIRDAKNGELDFTMEIASPTLLVRN